MRVVPRRWSNETWICSLRGHVAPAAHAARLRSPVDDPLGIEVGGGDRLCRCLRCDAWVRVAAPTDPTYDVLPPADGLPRPHRGKVLEDRIFLRLIAIERGIHSVIFGLFAIGLVLAKRDFTWLVQEGRELVDNTSRDGSLRWLTDEAQRVTELRSSTISMLMITATLYCVLEGVEAVGLWKGRRWAEYLTVVATAGFLPFEIEYLTRRVTGLRVAALVVNLAILVYLVWGKRLFGLRGGASALRRDLDASVDWDDLLAHPPTRAG
jgi:uncharacterized membrane protein (DUF2068 family)